MTYETWSNEFSKGKRWKFGPFQVEYEHVRFPYFKTPSFTLMFGGDYLLYKCIGFQGKYLTFSFWSL